VMPHMWHLPPCHQPRARCAPGRLRRATCFGHQYKSPVTRRDAAGSERQETRTLYRQADLGQEPDPTLVGAARAAHPEGDYRVADAASLPFGDCSFDLVIAYNSLMDIDDMPGAVREAARVLMPGGRYLISILHPANTGKATGQGDDVAFVVDRSYFETRLTQEHAERDGVSMVFTSYRRSLSRYASALEEAGFVIETMREPTSGSARNVLPWHLWLRAVPADR